MSSKDQQDQKYRSCICRWFEKYMESVYYTSHTGEIKMSCEKEAQN
jgi:hypothetical protein